MKKRVVGNLKIMLLTMLCIIATMLIVKIPWWSFVVPIILLGLFIGIKKWEISTFITGFVAGFLVWCGATLYYNGIYDSSLLGTFGQLMGMPGAMIYVVAGIIGGLLSGLALFTGSTIIHKEEKIQ